jgi:two-component system, NtrC family, nitrogen regulation sensor histidine kinase GlnL
LPNRICYDFWDFGTPMNVLNLQRKKSPPKISWEQILAGLEDGVITVDRDGKISYFNEAAEVLTELSSSQALQKSVVELFRREDWLVEQVKKSQPPRQESTRGEGDFVTRWGHKVPVSLTVSPLQDRHGNFLGSVLVLRDLKHRKELEEDLQRADRLAIVGTLAAGLAHEIRNPLGGIKGAAQLLKRSLDQNSSLLEYANIMIREVDRVDKLIEQLLDLARPAKLDLTAVNIHEVLEDVLLLETHTAEALRIAVKKRFDPSLPPIRGDRAQLTQVFLNLVKNAFQAMHRGGILTIATRLETDFHIRGQGSDRSRWIWVDVEDEGIGIKEQDLPHIFSPFFTTKNHGTGLGLAVCYRIVREHGGLIRVDSIEGKGTTFRISLVVAN